MKLFVDLYILTYLLFSRWTKKNLYIYTHIYIYKERKKKEKEREREKEFKYEWIYESNVQGESEIQKTK